VGPVGPPKSVQGLMDIRFLSSFIVFLLEFLDLSSEKYTIGDF
jgi:hypothetical protein